MSKAIVNVKEKKYFVSSVSVVLKLNSGPLIHLRLSEKLDGRENKLSNEETFKQEFFQDICQEVEGSFEWGGQTIKFILVGYNSSEARTFELVGLVIKKDVIEWFNQNNFKDKKQDYLIYQKSNGGNSWPWFNKVLGNKFEQPNPDLVDKIKLLFPDNACIWRYKDSNNFQFLNRSIAFASRHLPEVQGWCAFDADKPLRLILFEEKKQDQTIPKLDPTWNPSHLFLPNRYSWNRWLDRSCTLSRDLSIKPGQEIALIKQLVSDGSNGEDAQKGQNFQAQNPTRLLFTPGTINIGDRNIFCHTVSYEFKLPAFEEKESPSVTMKIEMDYPERHIGDNEVISLRLFGKFQRWEKEKDEETKVKIAPPDLNNWGIIDEKDQRLKSGDDAVLYTQILSPTYSDKKYSGIYIKHEKDDEMIVDIHPCGIPLVLGSVQKYRKELEEADITLCGEKLAISVSSHSQSLASAEAIILDNSEIKLNHGKKILGQAQQNVDFLSQNIELGSSQIEINSGQTKINSSVNVSFPSPKFITINNQTFDVGSASGENNLCLLDTFAQLANQYTNNNGSPDKLKDIFKTFLADETGLIKVGSEQDFMDRNISENLLLTLSHENKENFEIQVYDQNPDGSITKYEKFTAKDKGTGEDQYPGKKPIVLQMLRTKTGEDQHHFVPLFPREQAVGANHETEEHDLPAALYGGGKRKWPEATYGDRKHEAKRIKEETGFEVTGNTHEYEHVIRDSVTREGYGADRKKDVGGLERDGFVYAEGKDAHKNHPGTGTKRGNNLSGMYDDEYAKAQSEALRGRKEEDGRHVYPEPDIGLAVAINQSAYAFTPEFVEQQNTKVGEVARDSYRNMVNEMGPVKFAGGQDSIESVEVSLEQKAQMLADRQSAETGIYHEGTVGSDGTLQVSPIPDANNARNLKDEYQWFLTERRKREANITKLTKANEKSKAEEELKVFEERWARLMDERSKQV